MKKELRYSRLYLGLFSIIGIICGLFFLIMSAVLAENDDTAQYFLYSGILMLLTSVILLAGVSFVKRMRILGSSLISLGSLLFILAITFSLYRFGNIFTGIWHWLIPILIWLPLCAPFTIIIVYIWRWSRK